MAMLQTLAVANYRSIRSLILRLDRFNLITGSNGSGKSRLYWPLRLGSGSRREPFHIAVRATRIAAATFGRRILR
jgi:predicted ATPase